MNWWIYAILIVAVLAFWHDCWPSFAFSSPSSCSSPTLDLPLPSLLPLPVLPLPFTCPVLHAVFNLSPFQIQAVDSNPADPGSIAVVIRVSHWVYQAQVAPLLQKFHSRLSNGPTPRTPARLHDVEKHLLPYQQSLYFLYYRNSLSVRETYYARVVTAALDVRSLYDGVLATVYLYVRMLVSRRLNWLLVMWRHYYEATITAMDLYLDTRVSNRSTFYCALFMCVMYVSCHMVGLILLLMMVIV